MVFDIRLKKIAVESFKAKKTNTETTMDIFQISHSSLFKWIDQDHHKKLENKRTRTSKFTPVIKCYIRNYVVTRINFKYTRLIALIWKNYRIKISKSSIYNLLKTMNITKKKIYKRSFFMTKIKKNQLVKEFKDKLKDRPIDDIISIDESSFDTHIHHNYGWSLKGKKITVVKTKQRVRYTVIAAVSTKKVLHIKIIKNSANRDTFLDFINELIAKLEQNKQYSIILDNARIHHALIFKNFMLQKPNLKLVYNVPYSPEYNPVEKVFNEAKNKIKDDLTNAVFTNKIKKCFKNISAENLFSYFKKSLEFL